MKWRWYPCPAGRSWNVLRLLPGLLQRTSSPSTAQHRHDSLLTQWKVLCMHSDKKSGWWTLTLLFSVGSRDSNVLLSTSPISSSDTLMTKHKHHISENGWREHGRHILKEKERKRKRSGPCVKPLQVHQRQEMIQSSFYCKCIVNVFFLTSFIFRNPFIICLTTAAFWARQQRRNLHFGVWFLWQSQTKEEWRREWGNRPIRLISTASASSLPPAALTVV